MLSPVTEDRTSLLQGGELSSTLFILFMDEIIKQSKQCTRGLRVEYINMQRVKILECAFPDDVVIFDRIKEDLKEG